MHESRPSAGIFWRFAMNEFWKDAALVALGSVLGAYAFGLGCGCLSRWRWNRQWRALAARNERDFCAGGHASRFLAETAQRRADQRAKNLQEAAR
jgi:hypothetical protein